MLRRFISCQYGLPLIVSTRNAGHSKWANIKHTKALKDGQKGQLTTKLMQKIRVSIFENNNNANPGTNLYLQQAIEVARKNNVPIATIQNCIKQTQTDKTTFGKPWDVVVKGPKGIYFLVSLLSNSPQKTKYEIATIIKKNGCSYLDSPVKKLFERKGKILAVPPSELSNPAEASIDHAIEAGAEEVQPTGDDDQSLEFICEVTQFHNVKKKLEELRYSVTETDLEYIPRMKVTLSDMEIDSVGKLIEKLEEHPDVIRVYDNIE